MQNPDSNPNPNPNLNVKSNRDLWSKRRHQNKVALNVIHQSYFTGEGVGLLEAYIPARLANDLSGTREQNGFGWDKLLFL